VVLVCGQFNQLLADWSVFPSQLSLSSCAALAPPAFQSTLGSFRNDNISYPLFINLKPPFNLSARPNFDILCQRLFKKKMNK
jgi:hypothetical protein